jgi:hypothetical protein
MISISVKPVVSFVERPRLAAVWEQRLQRVGMVHLWLTMINYHLPQRRKERKGFLYKNSVFLCVLCVFAAKNISF